MSKIKFVDGELENKGIFDILDTYKIMTMKLHNRMPIYIDFDYKIRIVKYSLARSKNEVHQDIFNIISDYFKNNIEKYDTITHKRRNIWVALDIVIIKTNGLF